MSKKTESEIKLTEKTNNGLRRFGQAVDYFPAYITSENGDPVPALFTASQIEVAIERAKKNLEDVDPQDKGGGFFGLF